MNVELSFTLSSGTYTNTTVFASFDECKQRMMVLLESDDDSIAFEGPGQTVTVLASRHIVGVTMTAAGEQ
ncbi:hypothetical protein ACIBQ6_22060 [Nonomuraea sp. NPDC049655]|uniref:hypothetical protein n=1 Tax=Nonomuraea sp. NPDC049655 TaxID=3364355 RepID=UPI0037A569A1